MSLLQRSLTLHLPADIFKIPKGIFYIWSCQLWYGMKRVRRLNCLFMRGRAKIMHLCFTVIHSSILEDSYFPGALKYLLLLISYSYFNKETFKSPIKGISDDISYQVLQNKHCFLHLLSEANHFRSNARLIFTVSQRVKSYFMSKDYRIAFIVHLYLNFCVVVSWNFLRIFI